MEKNFFDQFDSNDSNSSPNGSSGNFFDQFDQSKPKRKKSDTSERSVTDIAKDTSITALKGLISVPEAIIGLADIPTGGRVGKKLDDWGFRPGEAKQVLDEAYSEPQQAANRAVREAEGFVDTASAAIQNPSTIATTVGESIPQMLGGAAVARGVMAVAPKVVPWLAGAIGEGVVGAGSAASSIRGETEDGLLTGKQAAAATASGVGTALLGAAGGKVAQKLGIGDVDTLLAQGGANLATKNSKGFVRQLAEGGLTEGVFEELPQSIQEQMLQNFALDKPLTDGVGNAAAMGLLAGVATGGAAGGFNATTQRFESKPEPQNEAIENPETSTENAVTFKPDPATPATTTNTAPSDLEQRLVEIELLAEQRELTPDEFSEYESIASQIEAEEKRLDSELSLPPEPVEQDQPVGSQNVAIATDDEAVRALKTPVQLTALDRAQELDSEIGRLTERLTELSPQNGYGEAFDTERNEIASRAQELAMERDEIAKTWPKAVPGIETEFSTESGAKIQGQYAIMDAADLVTSNDENLKANPLYPKELQPRDRSRQASEIQISGIVGKLDPARLGVSADAATGAPIVGADGLVESGNARTIALKRVYQANGQKAEDYKSFLRANAQQFGLTPEQIDQVQKPVLVRVRSTPVNRAEFARQANASTVQRMSPSEAALSDASRLTSLEGLNPDENGDFDSSIDFIRQFMATLPITEQSDMLESDGRLSTTGYRRIQNAVLAKAYGDSPTLRRMTESRDDNLRNITKALTFAAPTIAAARERIASGSMYDADIASDLIQAVEGLSSIKQRGWTVDQELAQTDLTGPKYSEESAELLNFLDQNIRSPRRIAEFMQRYYEALEAAGDPNQGTMFDEPVAPTRQGLINQARGQNVPTTANTERGVDPEAAQAAQESGGQPENAPRNQGRNQGDEGPGSGTGTRSEESSREDANWVNYPKDSGTLGIPRAQMPQIKSEARGALVQFLKARGIDSESKSVPASELKPTQAEYSADKVKRFIESGPVDGSRSVLISSDNHVLDGHHQWMTFQATGKDVPVIQLNAPIRELLEQVYEFPSAKRSEGAPAESGTETTAASNSPFPTISETKAPSIGPMGSAKITPIAPGKPLFRQTNLEGLDDVARYDNQAEIINLFVTDNVDLALGQAGNKGVLIEFRPDSLSGTENVKPGTGDATGREYKANVMAKRPIAAVTMNAVDFPRLRGVTRNLLKREFTKSVLGDGIVQYKRNGLEVTGETGSIASKGTSKTVPKTKTTALPIAASKKRNTEDAGEELVGEFKTREEDGGVVLFNRETESLESGDLNETADDIVRRVLGVDTATARAAMDRISFPWQNRSNNIKSLANRRDALEVEALSVLAAWKNPPKLVVVESLQDARTPLAIRRLDEKQRAQGASGSIPGFFFNDTVYLVADSVADRASMLRTLAHESFVHYGLRSMYGNALDGILAQIYQARPDLVKKKAQQYGMDISDKRQRLEAAEEVLAEMAETDPNLGFVRRAIAAIRTWLRANIPFMNQLSLTDDEILQNFIAPARNWVKNGTRQATLAPAFNEQNPAFSRSADITTSEQFKKWFGDWQQAASARMPRAVTGLEQARDTAKTFVGKPIVNRSTELVGMVSNTNLSKMASQKAGDKSASMPDHALAIANLDRLFENAVLDHSHPDNKGEPTIKAIRRYIAPMFGVNGNLRAVKLTVKETTGPKEPNPIYTVEAMEIESPPSVLSRANPDATGIRPQAGLNPSVKTMLDQVNDVSKVVDQEGKPLVVYHGTQNDFTSFSNEWVGEGNGSADWGEGFYFASNPAAASTYAIGEGANVMPVYLSIKNPADKSVMTSKRITDAMDDGYFDSPRDLLMDMGYDGVIIDHGKDGKEFVVFSPEQIKSALGNQGTFDSGTPDIRFSRTGLSGSVPPTPGKKQQSRYSLLKEKLNDLLSPENIDTLIYNMQDRFIDLKRLRDHIKEIGGNVSDLNDVYLGEELYHKRLAKRVENFLADEIKPLMAQLRVRNVTTAEFEHYLHARHAPEANKVLAERNPNQEMINKARKDAADQVKKLQLDLQSAKAKGMATKQIEDALDMARANVVRLNMAQAFKGTEAERNALSGMSDAESSKFISSLAPAKLQAMKDLAAMVDAMNEKTLKTLEQYGLETKQTLDAWRNEYKHYVPLFRDEDHADRGFQPTGQGFSTKGSSTKSRIGSNAKVTNILGHIAIRRENALTRGEKNRVAKQLYLLAMQNKDPNVWQVDKPPTTRNIDSVTGFVRVGADDNYRERPNVVMVRVAGVDRAVVFNERNPQALRAAGALKNLDMSDLGALVGFIQKGTRWFASVNTQYNPVFGLINFARDVQSALLNLSTTPLAGKEKQVTKNIPGALRAIYRDTRGKPSTNKDNAEWMRLWNEMQLEGGSTGYRELFANAEDRAKALIKEIDALDRGSVKKAAYAVVDWLSDYNETMENAVRVAAYKAALDQGLSKPRAASVAKNLTVNFNRKGAKGQTVGAWYAFFNAAIQGTTRMLETLSGPAGRKIMLGGVALGMTSSMIAMAMMGGLDGDEDDDEYSKIPDFVKERSLIIPLSSTRYLALPLPLGFHVIPNIGRIAAEAAFGRQDISRGKRLVDFMVIGAEAFNPIGGFGTPMQMIAPTILDPLAALTQNADWTGAPIYKEDFSSLNPTPGFTRTKDTASTFSKLFAEAINKVTGGTDYMPGSWSPTPDQLDYMIGQLTGGVGREALKLTQFVGSPFTGEDVPAYKIPILGRIYGTTEGQAGQSGKFYENIRDINILENEVKGRAADGKDFEQFMQENPMAELYPMANAQERYVRTLREDRRRVIREGLPGFKEVAKQYDEDITNAMKELNQEVQKATDIKKNM